MIKYLFLEVLFYLNVLLIFWCLLNIIYNSTWEQTLLIKLNGRIKYFKLIGGEEPLEWMKDTMPVKRYLGLTILSISVNIIDQDLYNFAIKSKIVMQHSHLYSICQSKIRIRWKTLQDIKKEMWFLSMTSKNTKC